MHVLQRWENNGIKYYITGNAAPKGYVGHDAGNIPVYGMLDIPVTSIQFSYIPLLSELYLKIEEEKTTFAALLTNSSMKPRLIGYFNELGENLHIDLTNFPLIQQQWSCDSNDVVSIKDGFIIAKQEGTADVTITIVERTALLRIEVLDEHAAFE